MIDAHRTILDDILIIRLPLGIYHVNTYLVGCRLTGHAVVIDPADKPEGIVELASFESLTICKILNTHGHFDHTFANAALQDLLQVRVYIHPADHILVQPASGSDDSIEYCRQALVPLSDRQTIDVGKLKITVLHTPGHTPGSVCYLCGGQLFTGDTLFVGDVGRTDLEGGAFQALLRSLETRIITLPPETRVWPGHDYGETPVSTIGREI